ncbi:glutamate receptor 2.5 isoform X2 [Eutrema salsugineum]|uniref:glutamate receptor 2.5 isoform X2 n=1 Tax=Eutrema salsugineum TaxID=72664 RepID=UPI000CECE884|nr:glutamate receptor 2.5 isoform X2 [Eutrema salsugineum]
MSFIYDLMYRSHPLRLLILLIFLVLFGKSQKEALQVKVGIVLDTTLADLSLRAINMSLSEFYNTHNGFKTRIVLNIRDSKQTVVGAAASALYLIKKREVVAIIGPGSSMQAPFLINLGNQSQVPIISFSATSPLLDSLRSPYFIRATHDDSAQVHAISAIIESFRWREVVSIYVDNEFGEGILPYLVDAFQEINVRIRYRSAISLYFSDDQIRIELYKLMNMPSRVFVVHMLPDLGARLFAIAKEIGMMSKGYVWIVTNGIANLMSLMGESSFEDMHGVLGVKTYLSRSKELAYLEARWRKRFGGEELNNFGYWAYDAATALAMSVEEISNVNMSFNMTTKNVSRNDIGTDLDDLGVSLSGPKLIQALSKVSFKGVAGRFQLKQGKLEATIFKIINIEESGERTIGFWKSEEGLMKNLKEVQKGINISQSSRRLGPIIWPGDTILVPKGWDFPINAKKLRIAVPKKDGFNQFVKVTKDAHTNVLTVTGFCIDVFDTVIRQMPYAVPFEYIPFETPDGLSDGNYDEMIYKVFLGEYDGAVGDTTILANRSAYVDFALPYSETGIVFVVPVKDEREKGKWVFLKPLTKELWLLTAAAFLYIGMMVWIFEYQADDTRFREQDMTNKISNVFYFSFSTLFFAHRKPSESFFTRALVVVWCFVLLILTQSYTATLTSMLTVQELRPTVRHMDDLRKSGVNIGYQSGSFTFERLKQMGFDESRLKTYDSPQEMRELFLNKSSNGGIGAAFDEVPYVKLFMAKYCKEYSIIEPSFKADGFGFAFPLGSPLVSDISRQILNITEGEGMKAMENKWFVGEKHCLDSTTSDSPIQLDHHSFQALFLIVFVFSVLLLLLMLACKKHRERQGDKIESGAQDGVNEEDNVGDGDEAEHIVDVDTALLRRKKLTSRTMPLRRVAPLLRLKSA